MLKYFGTDGFRGVAGETLTSLHAYKIGRYLGWYFSKSGTSSRILIGKDTRISGYMFEYSLIAGITASGGYTYMMHVTTTPSISYITRRENFDCGIMITASHNPFGDNGIKINNSQGEKMQEDFLEEIEKYIDGVLETDDMVNGDLPYASGYRIGKSIDYAQARENYMQHLLATTDISLKGKKIALDLSNGSSWMMGEEIFRRLGADVVITGNKPTGTNINRECGSTDISNLCQLVKESGADFGFAFDGDADRCIAVDENGNEVNGDKIIYLFAKQYKKEDRLYKNKVVITIMSNMGLNKALENEGIEYVTTTVGDRFIYEQMKNHGYVLGGEQSGHIILRDIFPTGDGLLTAIKICEACLKYDSTLGEMVKNVVMLPQVTKNIKVKDKQAVCDDKDVTDEIEKITEELKGNGRILLRKSGTEPVIRIMAEAETEQACNQYIDRAAAVIESKCHIID